MRPPTAPTHHWPLVRRLSAGLLPILAIAAVLLFAPRSVRAQEAPTVGSVPVPGESGMLVAEEGATLDTLLAGLESEGCYAASLAVDTPRGWSFYTEGAPDFVNAAFPTTIEEQAPLFARCRSEIEVRVPHGDIVLAGTLTLPPVAPPYPAAILVSGSGGQDRNESIPGLEGYGPFRWIADHLQAEGIAVLRYDDRGIAESTGEQLGATTGDFADDAEAVFDFLLAHPLVDPDEAGIIGHSEGGTIGAMIAARNDAVDFLVSIAGIAIPGGELLQLQQRLILEASGAPPEVVEAEVERAAYIQTLTVEERWDELEALFYEIGAEQLAALPPEQAAEIDLDTVVAQDLLTYQTYMRYLITYDPVPDLEQVDAPVLGIFGGLDLQVPADANRPAMEQALAAGGNEDVTVTTFPTANHLFQVANTGSPAEYPILPMEFVPGFLDAISTWLLPRVEE